MKKQILKILVCTFILLIGIGAVNALEDNSTDEVIAFNQNNENVVLDGDEVLSVEDNAADAVGVNDDSEVVSVEENNENISVVNDDKDILNTENNNQDIVVTCDKDCEVLSVENNNEELNLASNDNIDFLSVNIENDEKLSLWSGYYDNTDDDSDDTSYDNTYTSSKVYSTKKWKSIRLTKFKVKKHWSKSKRNKIINKKWKKANKKISKLVRKYGAKGWHYGNTRWIWHVGSYKVKYKYYVQFYKTVYYNSYGDVLYVC